MSNEKEYEHKTYEQALKDGEKRGLQKLLEKAFVIANAGKRWLPDMPDGLDGPQVGVQLANIVDPEALGGQALVLVQEVDKGGESGMYPLAIILDPGRMNGMEPTLSNEQYDELNNAVALVASSTVENEDGEVLFGDIAELDKMTSVIAQKSIEELAEIINEAANYNKLAAALNDGSIELSDEDMEDETEDMEDEA